MAAAPPKPWQWHDFFTNQDELLRAILTAIQAQAPSARIPTPEWPGQLIKSMKEIKAEIIKIQPGKAVEALPVSLTPDPGTFPGGFYAGAAVTYQTIIHWEIGRQWNKKFGNLHQIGLTCNAADFPNTEFRFRIERPSVKKTMFYDFTINAQFSQFFPDNVLERETDVYIECRSPAGVPLTGVWAELSGAEWS